MARKKKSPMADVLSQVEQDAKVLKSAKQLMQRGRPQRAFIQAIVTETGVSEAEVVTSLIRLHKQLS